VLKQLADQGHSIFLNSHLLQEIELICSSVAISAPYAAHTAGASA
jgi:ABC-type multidrug transport system ATPase subunit